MKHFIITGCARSGTGYTAKLLTHLGVATEHETLFSPYTTAFDGWGSVTGESSWLAGPFIRELPAGTVVLHQVRDPYDVVQSLLGLRYFDPGGSRLRRNARSLAQVARARGLVGLGRRLLSGQWRGRGRRLRSDFLDFTRMHCPMIFDSDNEIDRCWRYWVEWNQLVENQAAQAEVTYTRFRLEDLDASLVIELLDLIGESRDEEEVAAALKGLPSSVNTRPTSAAATVLTGMSAEAGALALRYGYSVDEV